VALFPILWFLISRIVTSKRFPELTVATIAENNITVHTPYAYADYKWPYFERFGENNAVFVLFIIIRSRVLVILPKRVMTPEQIVAVRTLFQAHITLRGNARLNAPSAAHADDS